MSICNLDELVTESDIEQKLAYPILTARPPDGLGFSPADIATKHSIRRFEIDKGNRKQLYFPDYVIVIAGLPVAVIEAKGPDEDVEDGFREARLYALELNALYPAGKNPCRRVVAVNGHILVAGEWDADSPTHRIPFSELHPASRLFAEWVDRYERARHQEWADRIRAAEASRPFKRPTKLLGGQSTRNEEIGHNSFGRDIALDFRGIFNPATPDDRVAIVRNAYVSSKRKERYVEPIDRLIRGVIPPTISHLQDIADTEKPREITELLRQGQRLENHLVLLVGSVGCGKSTFADYLSYVALPQQTRDATVWARVNLNVAPLAKDLAYKWVASAITEELRKLKPDTDFDELETLEKVYAVELRRLKRGPLKLLEQNSAEWNTRLADELRALIADPIKTAQCTARHLCGEPGKLLIVVLDNCDKRNRDEQLLMFEIAGWLQREFRCLTMLPIRDVTYDAFRNQPPLDTTVKDLVFRIEPPLFFRVLERRVKLAMQMLSKDDPNRLSYTTGNGVRIDYPASDQGMYLACILRSLFEYDRFLRRVLTGLASRDIRKALEIFLEFCSSGHIDEGELFKIRHFKGQHVLPFRTVANVLLRMDYRFYDGDRSHLKNVFQCSPEDPLPDHFVRFSILAWLSDRQNENGPSGLRGYFPVETLLGALARLGHDVARSMVEVRYLLEARCIVAEHQRLDSLDPGDLVALSPAGSVHLELVGHSLYLAACAEDTWFSDTARAERIARRIGGRGDTGHFGVNTLNTNARELVEYIDAELSRGVYPARPYLADSELHAPLAFAKGLEGMRGAIGRGAGATIPRRICLRNLPYSLTIEGLRDCLAEHDVVDHTDVFLREREGGSSGFAFVEFASHERAEQAIEVLDGIEVLGRTISADQAYERPRRASRRS